MVCGVKLGMVFGMRRNRFPEEKAWVILSLRLVLSCCAREFGRGGALWGAGVYAMLGVAPDGTV